MSFSSIRSSEREQTMGKGNENQIIPAISHLHQDSLFFFGPYHSRANWKGFQLFYYAVTKRFFTPLKFHQKSAFWTAFQTKDFSRPVSMPV
jgi:hypothetical protein